MKGKRMLWAGALTAVAVAALAGYTAAGAMVPMETIALGVGTTAVFAPLQLELPAEIPTVEMLLPEAEPEPGLLVSVRSDELPEGAVLNFYKAEGSLANTASLSREIGAACALAPGGDYRVEAGGLTARFHLEANAAITNVEGAGWTDGEVLYLTASPRGAVTVLVSVGNIPPEQTVVYRLTGPDCDRTLAAGCETGELQRKLIFADLAPGDYTLTAPDGQTRTVTLPPQAPAVTISLE